MRRIVSVVCVAAMLAFAGYCSVRWAWADYLAQSSDVGVVTRAVRLSPGNAGFRLKLARLVDKNGGDPAPPLEAAVQLNPSDAAAWMRLGLNAEMHGDYHAAESDLLEAARVSRRFAPRWALANYYVRRNDADHVWPWVRQALEIGNGGDLAPVFALCWNTSHDADLILSRAIPDRVPALNAYLTYLTSEGRFDAGVPVAHRLLPLATVADRPALLSWNDGLLESRKLAGALDAWNAMCSRGLLPYLPLDPERGVSLTDGGFERESCGAGFDWRVSPSPGVNCGRSAQERYRWFSFSGSQSDRCEPLWQYMALVPGGHYRMRFQYRTSDMPAQSGLHWEVQTSRSAWLSSPAWKDEQFEFTAPPTALARLVLTYQKIPGTPRLEGSLLLSRLKLERLP